MLGHGQLLRLLHPPWEGCGLSYTRPLHALHPWLALVAWVLLRLHGTRCLARMESARCSLHGCLHGHLLWRLELSLRIRLRRGGRRLTGLHAKLLLLWIQGLLLAGIALRKRLLHRSAQALARIGRRIRCRLHVCECRAQQCVVSAEDARTTER